MDNHVLIVLVPSAITVVLLFYLIKYLITRKFVLKFFNWSLKCECGHYTKVTGKVTVRGKDYLQELNLKNGVAHYCFACLSKRAISCAWCKMPIFSDSKKRVYQAIDPDFYILPSDIKPVSTEPTYLVGCTRNDCPGFNDALVRGFHRFAPVKDSSNGHAYENILQLIYYSREKQEEDSVNETGSM